ncbi:UNKNOWN [Stylonychia lemnae]|uniref:Transmembrane protein 186 n=1 Tax=Stylonychia lemnae TaxID=5949 RepID=A0A077ZZP8_STYLE|nr:UNKNOWN [Stylonychia lemnae]|eukprot:CDW75092.1 UNKNOWN [Stylonychia lemnae]
MNFQAARFSTSYIPKIKINFIKRDSFHLYHNETGERLITNLTRLNMIFIAGNSLLLLLEVLSPFFGYWHGVSLSMTLLFSFIGTYMIQYYSTRLIHDIYIIKDGKFCEVTYYNALWIPKTEKLRIVNFGYFNPSRLYNVDMATYQQKQKIYINLGKNIYKDPEHNEMVKMMLSGKEFDFNSFSVQQVTSKEEVINKIQKIKKKKQFN